jgi:hypothetical protein
MIPNVNLSRPRVSVLLCCLACLVAGAHAAPSPSLADPAAGLEGAARTHVQIVNRHPSAAVRVEVTDSYLDGAPHGSSVYAPLAAGAVGNYWAHNAAPQRPPGLLVGQVAGNGPIGVSSRTNWESGSSLGIAEAAAPEPARELVLPAVWRDHLGRSTVVVLKNTNASEPAGVVLEAVRDGEASPAASMPLTLGPGLGAVVDAAAELLPADQGGFQGHLRIRASEPVVAQAFSDAAADASSVGALNALALGRREHFAPFVYADVAAGERRYSSEVVVLNPGPGAAQVSLRRLGHAGACVGAEWSDGPVALAPGERHVFEPPDAAGCVASATVTADEPVLAYVDVVGRAGGSIRGLELVAAADSSSAARDVLLSTVGRHVSTSRATSDIHVMNVGTAVATVQLQLLDLDSGAALPGCGAGCRATVAPGAAHRFWLDELDAVPAGIWLAARLSSDQPVVAQAVGLHLSGPNDFWVSSGMPVADEPSAGPEAFHLPLVARAVPLTSRPGEPTPTQGPTRTPRPTATPWPTHESADSLGQRAADSAIRVWGAGERPVEAAVDVFDRFSPARVALPLHIVPPDYGALFLPNEPELGDIRAGAARVTADGPLVATGEILLRDGPAWEAFEPPIAATEVVVPVVAYHRAARWDPQTTYLSVQNTDLAHEAQVELALYPRDGAANQLRTARFRIPAGRSVTVRLDQEPFFPDLPADFTGSAQLRSDRPVAALALIEWRVVVGQEPGLLAVAGVPADRAATSLAIPLAYAQRLVPAGRLRSTVTLTNPGPEAVRARVEWTGVSDNCRGQSRTSDLTVPGRGVAVTMVQPMTAPDDTAGCAAAGRVVAESGGLFGVVATVEGDSHNLIGGYGAGATSRAGRRVLVPLLEHQYNGHSSDLHVMNVGQEVAEVALTVYRLERMEAGRAWRSVAVTGCGEACRVSVAAGEAHAWSIPVLPGMAAGSVGYAVLEADQPIAAAAHDFRDFRDGNSNRRGGDASSQPGLQLDSAAAEIPVPLVLNDSRLTDGGPVAVSESRRPAAVSLPAFLTPAGPTVTVPVTLDSGGQPVSRVELVLDYDERWLRLDEADSDGDGVPDSVRFVLPGGFEGRVELGAAGAGGEIHIQVEALKPKLRVPDGPLLELELGVTGTAAYDRPAVSFPPAKPPAFRGPDGEALPGGGRGQVMTARRVYLPYSQR